MKRLYTYQPTANQSSTGYCCMLGLCGSAEKEYTPEYTITYTHSTTSDANTFALYGSLYLNYAETILLADMLNSGMGRSGIAANGGGNLLKDLTDITGWASTIRTAGEMDWNSMTKAQQQKVAYNMQKSLKSNGTRMYTRDIKANINGNFKSLNYKLGFASGILIGVDILAKGEIRPSHVVNGIMTGVGLTVWGSPVAAGYFLIDLGMGAFYDGGLSGYIDNTWGSPLYDF